MTLLICGILAVGKGDKYYLGDIYPYISDLGRDPPNFHIFAIGLFITGVGISASHVVTVLNWKYFAKAILPPGSYVAAYIWLVGANMLGALSGIPLIMLGVFDTCRFTTLHLSSVYAFFILEVLSAMAMLVSVVIFYKKFKDLFKH